MLTTLAAIVMLVTAAYLWHSAGQLQHRSVPPHGESDVTTTGAVLLMRATCVSVLTLAVLLLATSPHTISETSPQAPTELDGHTAAAEPSLVGE